MKPIGLGRSAIAIAPIVLAIAALCAPAIASVPVGKSAIAWHIASSDSEVDKAFALAKSTGKPVFLYWGAVWCPPCNQVKATLFSRPDFVERSRAFVPVYVDGDKPGAQRVASRFKVSGYPTMILFKPDGSEITRLPGEIDPQRYLLTLTAAMSAQFPVKDLLAKALSKDTLSPEQWQMLAFYSWDTDEQQVVKASELAGKLTELSTMVPPSLGAVRDRIALKAIVARSRDQKRDPALAASDRRTAEEILAGSTASSEVSDLLVIYAEELVPYLATTREARQALAAKLDGVVATRLSSDNVTRVDQLDALDARVSLWKETDGPELRGEHRQVVMQQVARIVSQTKDRYERQAVVPSAAHVLANAGMLGESDNLLKAELPRAVAPYYHMLGLAGNAKKRGDKTMALQWYEQAWKKSEGAATRIQWGVTYVSNVLELTPSDGSRIGSAAGAVIASLETRPETFFERNQRSLQRMAQRLTDWQAKDSGRGPIVVKLKAQLERTCEKLPAKHPGRVNCNNVFPQKAPGS